MLNDSINIEIQHRMYRSYILTFIPSKTIIWTRWMAWYKLVTCVVKHKRTMCIEYENHNLDIVNELVIHGVPLKKRSSGSIYQFLQCSQRNVYSVNPYVPRISKYLEEWETINWTKIYLYIKNLKHDTRSQEFQYKFWNHVFVNNYWLNKWKIKTTEKCEFCDQVDNVDILFLEM